MVLGRIIEQVNMKCYMQEWQLCLSSFSNDFPISIFFTLFLACFWETIWNILKLLCRIIQQAKLCIFAQYLGQYARMTTLLVFIFSSPELAQGELLGYRYVRRLSHVWTSVTSETYKTSVCQLLSLCTLKRKQFWSKFMKLCQNVNHHNI